ncbi:glycosyltransferase family 2 protein [Fictibacillus barbaricus]|uniref:Glycosyltransferase involved in cell wall biosynthesis n=1 Tax=Fictibacillus barbaricus TaxID=182136 RepID=A0ABU1U1M3_9BACL|nr:glycosyltransferase [Fictibacillus barbaricus]MDR7073364.1 glycosyltransferase involved in cell wall biosynthesis [Fictibacillus barbaricus]
MTPEISIIVPVYNIAQYLRKCLDSILAQTFKNFELIVVNDGSTDDSGLICEEYALKDARVKVINKKNGGLSSARNVGIKMAAGKYLGFVDGDDWILKDMYQNLYELCIETKSDIAICTMLREIDNKIVYLNRKEFITELDNVEAMRQLFKGDLYRFAVWNKLYNKKCFENIQFPEGRIHEDLSTSYKVFANAKKVVFTNYSGYIYVKRESSILTSIYSNKRLDAFIGWDEIIQYMDQKYPQLSKEYISCFVYWCIDNIFYILNQVLLKEKQLEYLNVIKKYIRKHFKEIIRSSELSFKSKFIITLINVNTRGFLYLYSFINLISLRRDLAQIN